MPMSVSYLRICCACFSLVEGQGFSLSTLYEAQGTEIALALQHKGCTISIYLLDWLLVIDLEFWLPIKSTYLKVFDKTEDPIVMIY